MSPERRLFLGGVVGLSLGLAATPWLNDDVPSEELWSVVWKLAVFAVIAVALGIPWLRRAERARAANAEGSRSFAAGRTAEARKQFERAQSIRPNVAHRANIALCDLRLYRVESARAALDTLVTDRDVAPVLRLVAEGRALAHVFSGDLTRVDLDVHRRARHPGARLIVAVAALREHRFADAERLLAEVRGGKIDPWQAGLVDALSAWCAFELRGERRPVDRAALFGEADPEGLLQHWPELGAFLDQAP